MLRNLPISGKSIESARLKWFTNSDADDSYNKSTKNTKPKLSTGAIIGILIGCLAVILVVLFYIRKKSPGFRRFLYTAHHKLIWNPRLA
jgi:hypothetical protein